MGANHPDPDFFAQRTPRTQRSRGSGAVGGGSVWKGFGDDYEAAPEAAAALASACMLSTMLPYSVTSSSASLALSES